MRRRRRRHRRTCTRWWRLVPAAVTGIVAVAILALRTSAIVHSHPAYLLTLIAVVLVSMAIAASACFERSPQRGEPSEAAAKTRSTGRVWAGRISGLIATAVLVAALAYLRPLPASDAATAAMAGTPAVQIAETRTRITIRPTADERRTGLVFYPGALVEPRAYVPNLIPIAAAGYRVVILKSPYNIALLDRGGAVDAIDANDGVDRWVVAGHSLGGVAAASAAGGSDPRIRGLLLWASFPNGSIADRSDLAVLSISGSRDGLSTPAKIRASADDLPASTEFVEVEGATHAFFGDYGTQSGDGTPTVTRQHAQHEIRAASVAFMARVDAGR